MSEHSEHLNDLVAGVGDGPEPWNADTRALADAVRNIAAGLERLGEQVNKIDRVVRDLANRST